MKERMQALIYQLNNEVGFHWTNEDKIKFTQLIVRECIDTLLFHGCDDDVKYLEWMAANKLGVKL